MVLLLSKGGKGGKGIYSRSGAHSGPKGGLRPRDIRLVGFIGAWCMRAPRWHAGVLSNPVPPSFVFLAATRSLIGGQNSLKRVAQVLQGQRYKRDQQENVFKLYKVLESRADKYIKFRIHFYT